MIQFIYTLLFRYAQYSVATTIGQEQPSSPAINNGGTTTPPAAANITTAEQKVPTSTPGDDVKDLTSQVEQKLQVSANGGDSSISVSH